MLSHVLLMTVYILSESFVGHECSELSFLSVASQLEHRVSNTCVSDVRILSDNLRNAVPWAVEMWESSAKYPTGLLQGSRYQLGNFDQCLGLNNLELGDGLQRQYCLTTLTLDYIYPNDGIMDRSESVFKTGNGSIWGLCVPASCSNEDLTLMLQDYTYFVRFFGEFNLTHRVIHNQCQIYESKLNLSMSSILFMCCVCAIVIIVLLATKIHYEREIKTENDCPKIIRLLSIIHNLRQLITRDDERLKMFHGLRLVTMVAVISTHFKLVHFTGPVANVNYATFIMKNTPIEMLIHAVGCGVDVFFVISGFFAFVSINKNFNSRNKLQIVFSRYFRLIPMYGFMLILLATISTNLGTGSLWHYTVMEQLNCAKNWWTNVLFINNYVNFDESCMPHTWYLACDFHFYLITILLCYFFAVPSRENLGLCITGALLIISMLINSLVAYYYRYGPASVTTQQYFENVRTNEEAKYFYLPSHTRMSPYIIGIFTAFIYQKYKNAAVKIPKVVSILLLICALACFFGNALYMISFKNSSYDIVSSTIYAAFHRPITGLCIGIIILVCIFGDLKLIVSFLGCTPIMVLARLTFAAYLISVVWQGYEMATARHPKLFSYIWTPLELLWSLMVIFILSLLGNLLVEAPFYNLYKIWTMREKHDLKKEDV